jgi:hypothetical protein
MGLEDLPLWPNVENVVCSDCPRLTELPLWSEVLEVSCSSCFQLKELPLWPNAEYVHCSICFGLKELPLWPNVETVDCSDCPNLRNLPLWSNVQIVDCYHCPRLNELPSWENIRKINGEKVSTRPVKFLKYSEDQEVIEDPDNRVCSICYDREKKVIFLACSHFICCQDCAIKIYNSSKICPYCKTGIDRMILKDLK